MTQVWRVNLKPEGAQEGLDPRMFCINKGIVGIGWAVDLGIDVDWKSYEKRAKEIYAEYLNLWWPAINALKNNIVVGDLCWTRDWEGMYYLGKIKSEWYYNGEYEFKSHDIVNIRDCEWHKVGTMDKVPGKVINSFIPGRTLQRVNGVLEFSKYLFNELSDRSDYSHEKKTNIDLFNLLSFEDCEDLVSLYMQNKGHVIIPSTYKNSTMNFEFIAINETTGDIVGTQVKNGYVDLNTEDYGRFPGKVFLFTSKGKYTGNKPSNVVCIEPSELLNFINLNSKIMPERIKTWQNVYYIITSQDILGE